MNSDFPQHYALNASGKEAINLGSISASGPIRSFAGQSRNGKFPPIADIQTDALPRLRPPDSYQGHSPWSPSIGGRTSLVLVGRTK